ncbi:MAG: hypothetical protein A3G24_09465 [Betaproteobacteria bacterium RIFCSPLOWO2_12_FULL_62_13]|nr:MAG: hypothetical protein A3G24_09465 [Betaproteobacteria bacterium RIFCSPLOWO2_12_FULL_62_13]
MHLAEQEQQRINELVAEVEAKSGAQILAAVIGKADAYPEIPWKAFALGASVAALLVILDELLHPDWASVQSAVFDVVVILGAGAALGLLATFAPPFARLFLDRSRAETEVRQYALAMFLERGVFETRDRIGVLLLVSLFERRIVILPDSGIRRHVSNAQIQAIVAQMTPLLARRRLVAAFQAGLTALAALLHDKQPGTAAHGNEIPDTVIEERGP